MKTSFDAAKADLPGWRPHTIRPTRTADGVAWHLSLWLAQDTPVYSADAAVVAIEVGEAESPAEARHVAVRLANECELAAFESSALVGDLAYIGPDGVPAVFARGRFAVSVMQAERARVPALDLARALDQHLARLAANE